MTRHFGLQNASGRLTPRGHSGNQPSAYDTTQYIGADLHQIPSGSIHAAPIDDDVRERAACTFATVILSLCFAIPLILAGIILRFQ